MGYDDKAAFVAAQKNDGMNEAIEWIEKHKNTEIHDENYTSCDGNDTLNCIGLKRIIATLKFYSIHYNASNKLNKYLEEHENLVTDFHHVYNKHLNEDNMSEIQSNKQFQIIHQQLTGKYEMLCDISKCTIYTRNNRERETSPIDCNDNKLSMVMDILDNIHCFFLHSVDVGYRIIDDVSINDYDSKIKNLRTYLMLKRKNVPKIRGRNRINKSKFVTNLTDQISKPLQESLIEEDEKKSDDIKGTGKFAIDGYLYKQSLHLKQFRKRFVILKDEQLFCYKSHRKQELTEKINLRMFQDVKLNDDGDLGQFKIFATNTKLSTRIFAAPSVHEAERWIWHIHGSMKPLNKINIPNENALPQFSFGVRHDYWSKTKGIFSKAPKGRYLSIKEEVTSNKMHCISMKTFEEAWNKANYLLIHSTDLKRLRVSLSTADCKVYNLSLHAAPNIDNILSVVLYTDYDSLSYTFSSTFRKLKQTESDKYTKKRNMEYWNWSKKLIETVNAFGTQLKDSTASVFYHGVSFIYFNSFVAQFNSPTSTTTKLEIATIFAKNDGIILEVGKKVGDNSKYVKYFNCAFVSSFANEDERLFIQPAQYGMELDCTLHILSIRNMSTDENYRKYIAAIHTMQCIFDENPVSRLGMTDMKSTIHHLIHSGKLKETQDALNKLQRLYELDKNKFEKLMINQRHISSECVALMNSFLSDAVATTPQYINKSLELWTKGVSKIMIDIDFIKTYVPGMHIHDAKTNLIRIDTLNIFFKNLIQITLINSYDNKSYDTISYWKGIASMLYNINKLSFSKLDTIFVQIETMCTLSYFSKYQSLCMEQNWKLREIQDRGYLAIVKEH